MTDTEVGKEIRAAYREREERLRRSDLGRALLAYESALRDGQEAKAAREALARLILAAEDEAAWRRERESAAEL